MTEWYDEQHGAMVLCLQLPPGIDEAVTKNNDGSYTVLIASNICDTKKLQAYEHAIRHILNDDWSKSDVQTIENGAHINAVQKTT